MSRLLRLLYLDTETFWRGGQEQLLGLMEGMAARGHHVSLAAPAEAPLLERASAAGVSTHGYAQRGEFSPKACRHLESILRAEGPFDVVHSNTPRTILTAAWVAARTDAPYLRAAARRVVFPLRGRLSAAKYNYLLDAIITVCESIRRQLIEGGVRPDLVHTVYEGVDFDQLATIPPAEDLSGLSGDSGPLVGTLGALTPEKGHQVLISAWGRVILRCPEAKLVLVGDGPCRSQLKQQCHEAGLEKSVCFAGFRDDSVGVLKRLTLFCQPSLSEGLSSALLEAMGCGLPVVASSVGGNAELVVDGETGLLVPPENDEALARALENLLLAPSTGDRMGESGQRRVRRNFTVDRKVTQTESTYLTLLDSLRIG